MWVIKWMEGEHLYNVNKHLNIVNKESNCHWVACLKFLDSQTKIDYTSDTRKKIFWNHHLAINKTAFAMISFEGGILLYKTYFSPNLIEVHLSKSQWSSNKRLNFIFL